MSRRLDIGVVSYGSPDKLRRTVASIVQNSVTNFRVFLIDNPHPTCPEVRGYIYQAASSDSRFIPVLLKENIGYAGGVRKLMELAETEYLAYCDNDIQIRTPGWDETLCSYLDRFHEIGMVFPNGGPAEIPRGPYAEIMWGVGFCWALNRLCMAEVGPFDDQLGHQEEADYCLRVRMAGWKCAAAKDVQVAHDASATQDPASIERINRGVVNFVNKWTRYFGGKNLNYHSPNVLRWDDWPPNALYLEEYWKRLYPDLNAAPETLRMNGWEYDLIKVPRLKGFYTGRII